MDPRCSTISKKTPQKQGRPATPRANPEAQVFPVDHSGQVAATPSARLRFKDVCGGEESSRSELTGAKRQTQARGVILDFTLIKKNVIN